MNSVYTTPLSLLNYRGMFQGQTALVVAAGPSAPFYQRIIDQYTLNKVVIVTIKQAYNFVGLPSGIHFFNSLNCQNYYINGRSDGLISIFQDDKDMHCQFNEFDIRLEVYKNPSNPWEDCLALSKNIEKYSILKRGLYRPWGPGIMLESVFYMLNHMGFSCINTIGFDVASPSGDYKHCYDSKPKTKYKTHDIKMYNYLRHISNLSYNTGHGPIKNDSFNEVELIRDLLPSFYHWLKANGTELLIHTNSSFLSDHPFVNYFQ